MPISLFPSTSPILAVSRSLSANRLLSATTVAELRLLEIGQALHRLRQVCQEFVGFQTLLNHVEFSKCEDHAELCFWHILTCDDKMRLRNHDNVLRFFDVGAWWTACFFNFYFFPQVAWLWSLSWAWWCRRIISRCQQSDILCFAFGGWHPDP